MHYTKRILTAVFLLLGVAAMAQSTAKKVTVDKIAAVVGDRIILQSDIKNSISDIARQGGTVPDNAACMLMEQAVVSKVLMLQAEKDSLPVTDDEVEAELDQDQSFSCIGPVLWIGWIVSGIPVYEYGPVRRLCWSDYNRLCLLDCDGLLSVEALPCVRP